MSDGTKLADAAIDQVREHANQNWFRTAVMAGEDIAFNNDTFTTDDIWDVMDSDHKELSTHDPRAMGAVMRVLKGMGVCRTTTLFMQSRRPSRHGAPIRVWSSRTGRDRW